MTGLLLVVGPVAVALLAFLAIVLLLGAFKRLREEIQGAETWNDFKVDARAKTLARISKRLVSAAHSGAVPADPALYVEIADLDSDSWATGARFLAGAFVYIGLFFALLGLSMSVSSLKGVGSIASQEDLQNWASGVQKLLSGFSVAFVPALAGVAATLIVSAGVAQFDKKRAFYLDDLHDLLVQTVLPAARSKVPADKADLTRLVPALAGLENQLRESTAALTAPPTFVVDLYERVTTALKSAEDGLKEWNESLAQRLVVVSDSLSDAAVSVKETSRLATGTADAMVTGAGAVTSALEGIEAGLLPMREAGERHAQLLSDLQAAAKHNEKQAEAVANLADLVGKTGAASIEAIDAHRAAQLESARLVSERFEASAVRHAELSGETTVRQREEFRLLLAGIESMQAEQRASIALLLKDTAETIDRQDLRAREQREAFDKRTEVRDVALRDANDRLIEFLEAQERFVSDLYGAIYDVAAGVAAAAESKTDQGASPEESRFASLIQRSIAEQQRLSDSLSATLRKFDESLRDRDFDRSQNLLPVPPLVPPIDPLKKPTERPSRFRALKRLFERLLRR